MGEVNEVATPYLDALVAHADAVPLRLNVPAHKGGAFGPPGLAAAIGARAVELDIPPQIPGIDIGPEPAPFAIAEALAADAWRAARTWFVVGGASEANRAACLALAARGTRVLVQRNVHSSTIDGLILAGLEPVWLAPEIDRELGIAHAVSAPALRRAIRDSGPVAGVILVSPTYFGAAADVATLIGLAHEHDLPVVVDEAWGAHFAFHPGLPTAALDAGADLVISSTHKMLGSLTQSAMIHLGRASAFAADDVARALMLLRTTSVSGLLLASLDAARANAAAHGAELIERSLPAIAALHARLREIPGVDVLDERLAGRHGVVAMDPFRVSIVLPAGGPPGAEVAARLRAAGVHLELTSPRVLVAIAGLGETDFEGLAGALAVALERASDAGSAPVVHELAWGEPVRTPRDAFLAPSELVPRAAAAGRISASTLAVYPPGIPNVVLGERLGAGLVGGLAAAAADGAFVRGAADPALAHFRVLA